MASRRAEGCLEAADLLRLAERRAGARTASLLDHVSACPACRRELVNLRALEHVRPNLSERLWPVRAVPWQGAAAAATAAAVLFVGFLTLRGPLPTEPPSQLARGPEPGAVKPEAGDAPQDLSTERNPSEAGPNNARGPARAAAPAPAAKPARPTVTAPAGPARPAPGQPALSKSGAPASRQVREERGRDASADRRLAYGGTGAHAAGEPKAAPAAASSAPRGLAYRDGVLLENGQAVPVLTREEVERAVAELDGVAALRGRADAGAAPAAVEGPGRADGARARFGGGFGGPGGPGAQADQVKARGGVPGGSAGGGFAQEEAVQAQGAMGGAQAGLRAAMGAQGLRQQARTRLKVLDPDPANAGLLDERPVFRVQFGQAEAAPGVTLMELDPAANTQNSVDLRTRVDTARSQTVARPARPLDPRNQYALQVDPGPQDAPGLSGGQAAGMMFSYQLLGKSDQERVRWALANRTTAPVSSALVFYSVGRYADALNALRSAPDDARLRAWRSRLGRLVAERRGEGAVVLQGADTPAAGGAAGPAAPGR